jgi:hypothetical protein
MEAQQFEARRRFPIASFKARASGNSGEEFLT